MILSTLSSMIKAQILSLAIKLTIGAMHKIRKSYSYPFNLIPYSSMMMLNSKLRLFTEIVQVWYKREE
jgi:hypothetical protein